MQSQHQRLVKSEIKFVEFTETGWMHVMAANKEVHPTPLLQLPLLAVIGTFVVFVPNSIFLISQDFVNIKFEVHKTIKRSCTESSV